MLIYQIKIIKDNLKYSHALDKKENPVINLSEDEEDDEPQGFFHKMFKNESEHKFEEKFLEKKRSFTNSLGLKKNKKSFDESNEINNYNQVLNRQVGKKNLNLTTQNSKQLVKSMGIDTSINKQDNQLSQNKKIKLQKKQKIKQPKQICQFYLNGACHKGVECTYSHDVIPIRKKTELCKYFLTGNCFKGNECVFSHNTKEFPCKFFHAVGYCDKGEACKYIIIYDN